MVTTHFRRFRLPPATAAAASMLIIGLSGCGGSPSTPQIASANDGKAGGASPTATSTGQGDPLKFAQCMREHGIDMPDPDANGGLTVRGKPGDETKMRAAEQACQKYAPGGGTGGGRQMSKEEQQKFLRFAQCMREHGVPMADPEFENGGVKMGIRGGPNLDKAKMDAAQKACQGLLPQEARGASGGGGDTGKVTQ